MSPVTENELQELKDLIQELKTEIKSELRDFKEEVNNKFNSVEKHLIDLEKSQARIDGRLEAQKSAIDKIPDLAEKVGELKNWRQIAIIFFTALITGTLGWFLRSGKF
ncbi:MAG: hypothetical protein DSM107014_05465 [Gomphosphaeria aponina SAG 52.96 = DSM 107014]|uniref:Uncharacterized protein n=1 Tax=Gomphosphaeria aponina SAG 52.96 = DSM 107014 TaxID=1521640 RepID=A0A941GPU0_9CHRO|nr:hypothetical protein [Gomphosphaeria aponina SAG 52.96 = DSM 107014]